MEQLAKKGWSGKKGERVHRQWVLKKMPVLDNPLTGLVSVIRPVVHGDASYLWSSHVHVKPIASLL